MNIKKLFLILCVLTSCKTVQIKNLRPCSVAGELSAGMDCANTLSKETSTLTLDETIDFLEDGAICISPEDWGKVNVELEELCQILGKKCSIELKTFIKYFADKKVKENADNAQ